MQLQWRGNDYKHLATLTRSKIIGLIMPSTGCGLGTTLTPGWLRIYANSLQCHTQWFLKRFQYENRAKAWQNQQNDLCAQRRLRSVWASAQSDQSQSCPPEAKLGPKLPTERTAKTLIRLGGCPGWSESSLGTKVILLVLSWDGSKFFFLESTYAAHIHFITCFTFCIEPNMKSFSHANNIVLRRGIYIHSLNWC